MEAQVERKRGRPRKEIYEASEDTTHESQNYAVENSNESGLSLVTESRSDPNDISLNKSDFPESEPSAAEPVQDAPSIVDVPMDIISLAGDMLPSPSPKASIPEIPHGWQDISSAPRNGVPVEVMDEFHTNIANVFWKKTRAFANPTHRWVETGFWCGELSGQKLNFIPVYWKYRERRR